MKYILIFLIQTIIVLVVFTPIVLTRFIWTFRWNDEIKGLGSVYSTYKKCYQRMVKKIGGVKPANAL